jgi:hypothetical protein
MLQITYPNNCLAERDWIVGVLLSEFLGIEYVTKIGDVESIFIESEGRKLELADTFFSLAGRHWLKYTSLPHQPLNTWDTRELSDTIVLVKPVIPVIFGHGSVEVKKNSIRLGIDVFGSSFFMLSRYEEVVKKDRDDRDRFPAAATLAYQENFLDRPIVNEYLEILWNCIIQLWPQCERKPRLFRKLVSADVDQPYSCGIKRPVHQIKQIGADLIKRKNPKRAVNNAINYFASKFDNYSFDPYLSKFDWMMDVNEKACNKMAFHFIASHSDEVMDGCYSLDEPVIRQLLQRINKRGHEIALHPSYNSYNDIDQLSYEVSRLNCVLEECGIEQNIIGSRQHYLRWSPVETANNLNEAGLVYDTTLSYADHVGFRCGCCYEYSFYNLVMRKKLSIKERPLIVMEATFFSYMGECETPEILKTILHYELICKQFSGDFVLLWHNSNLVTPIQKEVYLSII